MITQPTLDFFSELRANNTREWFQDHKKRYDLALNEFRALVAAWHAGLSAHYPDIADNDPKKAIFRIYRDVRFSTNKAPYKDHLGASLCKGGRTAPFAGYYLHLSPGESFFAGGRWMPENAELKKIRQEFDYNYEQLKAITEAPGFKEIFGDLSNEHSLKTSPRDYPADHVAIDWLKLKSFIVSVPIPDEQVLAADFPERIVSYSKIMKPFLDFLNGALD
jgi:uncharacterized protein (TIGR02453 family)